jgi:hypothetical protein
VRGCSEKIINLHMDSYIMTRSTKPNVYYNTITSLTNFKTENLNTMM